MKITKTFVADILKAEYPMDYPLSHLTHLILIYNA